MNGKYIQENPEGATKQLVQGFLINHWGSNFIASRGKLTNGANLPRILAFDEKDEIIGLATYSIDSSAKSCELVTLDAMVQGVGIGAKLLKQVESEARKRGCQKIWLVTTNDNPEAAAFYVKRGFRLMGVHLNALEKSREIKPQIPRIGKNGIPLQDEWEFEKAISADQP